MLAMIKYIRSDDAYYDSPIEGVSIGNIIDVNPDDFSRTNFSSHFRIMEGKYKGEIHAALCFYLDPYEVDASDELIAHLTTHNKAILENNHV